MKKTDLEKLKALKLGANLRGTPVPQRFGSAAATVLDKKTQRKLDQANGLLPFATKLQGELIQRLNTLAQARQIPLAELVTILLEKGLATEHPLDNSGNS